MFAIWPRSMSFWASGSGLEFVRIWFVINRNKQQIDKEERHQYLHSLALGLRPQGIWRINPLSRKRFTITHIFFSHLTIHKCRRKYINGEGGELKKDSLEGGANLLNGLKTTLLYRRRESLLASVVRLSTTWLLREQSWVCCPRGSSPLRDMVSNNTALICMVDCSGRWP